MNCRDFEIILTTCARAEPVDGITREQCLAHTETCARCAARLVAERALLSGVRVVVEELAEERASERVEAALLLALHDRAASGSDVLRMPQKSGTARWMWATAAATVLTLASTIAVSRLPSPSPIENDDGPRQAFVPLTAQPTEQIIPTVNKNKRVASGSRRRTVRHSIPQQDPDVPEIATDFMPLLDGDDLDSLDNSQLVRVELPGSALIAAGLPVDAEMANAPVKADVLLGHDGLARAIRFVR